MSEQQVPNDQDVLSAVVESALNEAIGTAGGILTGFLGLVTFLDEDGERFYRLVAGTEQNTILSLGMSRAIDKLVNLQAFGD
jgi:hypothetical protein